MLGAGKPFSPAQPLLLPQISKRSMETTTKLIPGGSFMSACRGDEDRHEVAVMGRENQAHMKEGAHCRSAGTGRVVLGEHGWCQPRAGGFSALSRGRFLPLLSWARP